MSHHQSLKVLLVCVSRALEMIAHGLADYAKTL